jgi:hypothetical protein
VRRELMKILGRIILALVITSILAFTQAAAPKYDPAQETTLKGTVQEVNDYQCPISGSIGTHISVKSGFEIIEVHLAPAKFLKEYGIVIKPGDSVIVTGMRLTFDGKPAMIAKTVADDRERFRFREDDGRPEW